MKEFYVNFDSTEEVLQNSERLYQYFPESHESFYRHELSRISIMQDHNMTA